MFEVCQIDTDGYKHVLDQMDNNILQYICHSVAFFHKKIFSNNWTNSITKKLTHIMPQELEVFVINDTINSHLKSFGNSCFIPTTLQGFMLLINGNWDFR